MSGVEILAAVGAGLSAVGTVSAAAGQAQQSRAQAQAADYNARVLREQADRERLVAHREAGDYSERAARAVASTRARLAASGVELGEGTPSLLQEDLAGETARGVSRILEGGDINAIRKEQEAVLQRMAGGSYRSAATSSLATAPLSAGGTLLTGLAPAFS